MVNLVCCYEYVAGLKRVTPHRRNKTPKAMRCIHVSRDLVEAELGSGDLLTKPLQGTCPVLHRLEIARPVILFSRLNEIILGYFDPVNRRFCKSR